MLLCVPESWVKQTEILAELGGSDMLKDTLKNIKPVVVSKEAEEKVEKVEAEIVEAEIVEAEIVEAEIVEAEIVEESKTEEKKEEVKTKEKKEKVEEKVEKVEAEIVEEPTAMFKPVEPQTDDVIPMGTRKVCPVQIVPTKKKASYKVQVGKTPKEEVKPVEEKFDESLESFKTKLIEKSINTASVKRMPTGLLEVVLINNLNQPVLITVDNDDTLFGLGTDVFFIGKINPLDEYTRQAILLTDESINAVINNVQIDPKFYVPGNLVTMISMIDTTSIHEHNVKKKKEVLEKAFKAILEMQPEIKKSLNSGEAFRFTFNKYKSIDDFSMISGNKSRVSNLHEQKLIASRTIRIDVHDKNVTLNIK